MKHTFAKGRFEVLRSLGSGGMGEVYEVLDREQGLHLALKQLKAFSPEALLQLKTEFRAIRDLSHPNLVSLGELVVEDGQGFFTMELVEGTDFLRYVRPSGAWVHASEQSTGAESGTRTVELTGKHPTLSRGCVTGEGPDDLPATRVGPAMLDALAGLDEGRLRDGLRQLVEGLLALHGAGLLHRDVKPPNILVTPQGRVVLLDFGLVTQEGADSRSDRAMGTPLYMSPEQIQSAQAGPASDWYAVGMLLYHALLGRAPLTGKVKDIFLYKLRGELEAPSTLMANVPPDLNALCVDLIKRLPGERPTGREVLGRLGKGSVPLSPAVDAPLRATPFVGRESELELLRGAYRGLLAGSASTWVVQGESGLGKTALVRTFLERVAREAPSPLVLKGRCHERESLPYKALDGVVDGLVEALRIRPEEEVRQIAPVHAGLLTQAFPVLGRLAPFAQAAARPLGALDAGEQRRRVFASLRDLLAAVALERPLLLLLEDMQWADADSLAALRAVFQSPGAPRVLLLITARGAPDELWAPPPPFGLEALGPEVRHVTLAPLSPARTLELLKQLLPPGAAIPDERAASLAAESGGHPLFVQELVLHLSEEAPGQQRVRGPRGFQLDEALWARISRLPLAPRKLLGLVALAGTPLPNEIFADAAELSSEEYAQAVAALRQGRLVRALGLKRQDGLEHFHGRIRDAVLAHLTPAHARDAHERLARAMERHGHPDAETLAVQWQGAGDGATALRYALEAAAQAEGAFAFERAVRLRRLALSLAVEPTPEQLRDLTQRLAEALARAGHNAESAGCYLQATQDAPRDEGIRLRARAAERFLLAGYLAEGMPQLREALEAVRIPWRRGSYGTLVALLGLRLRLKLRGLGFKVRSEAEVPTELLLRVDTLGACTAPLTLLDVIGASYYNARYVLAALAAGETGRLARGFAVEYTLVSALRPDDGARAQQLLAQSEALARQGGDPPEVRGFILLQRTIAAFTRDGDLEATLAISTEGVRLLREHAAGAAWELGALEQFANMARYFKGEWGQMRRSVLRRLAEAQERGDAFGISCASTASLNVTWLMVDDAGEALRRIDLASERYPRDRTYLVHVYEVLARVNRDLYLGEAASAHQRVINCWKPVAATLLQEVPMLAFLMWEMRARAALALAAQRTGSERKALLGTVRSAAKRVARTRADWGKGMAELQFAGAAQLEGNRAEALVLFESAEARFLRSKANMFLWMAQVARGRLLGGQEGLALVDAAAANMAGEGIVAPERIARAVGSLV